MVHNLLPDDGRQDRNIMLLIEEVGQTLNGAAIATISMYDRVNYIPFDKLTSFFTRNL